MALESTINDLRAVTLFKSLSDATLQQIAATGIVQSHQGGEHILMEGDPCRAVYFILKGEMRVYRVSQEGREQVLVRLSSGQAFNTVPAFQEDGRNRANAVTLDEVELCVLFKEDFLHLVHTRGDLAMAVLRDFADRLTHLTDLVEGLALHTVQGRLARFLLDHAGESPEHQEARTRTERREPEPAAVKRRWTQQEIATHLGTVRDMIGRGLRTFQDDGLIRLDRSRIILLDRQGLEEIAQEQ
ncbi:MAG: Crp/Fnr family transcriptional regulator [Anaerolineae bacterium]